jgi:hypothetical protein
VAHFVFNESPNKLSSAYSTAWQTSMCTLAEHFVVVSTERFDASLDLLSRMVSATSRSGRVYHIHPRQQNANVMSNDAGHTNLDRNVTVGALAVAQHCLRDAYASDTFLSNLEHDQAGWFSAPAGGGASV